MKRQWKGFVCGALLTLMVISLVGPAAATVGKKAVNLAYNNIKVTLDGKQVSLVDAKGNPAEPFIIDGTTYLPVRAVSSAMGLGVSWDQSTSTVQLTTKGYATPGSYGRTNPAPIGTSQRVTVKEYWGTYTAIVTVNNISRGAAAWAEIKNANMFNGAPPDGKEYILANITVEIESVSDDRAINVSEYNFTAFTSENAEYKKVSVIEPSPLRGQLYSGASQSGYVSFLVDENDTAPKMVYGADYYGTGGIWFKLNG